MKGYYTSFGYMGYIPNENIYILFSSENDYEEFLNE